MKFDLFRPESFLVFYTLFLGLAFASTFTNLPIQPLSLLGFLVFLVTFPFFILGVRAGRKIYGKTVPAYTHFLLQLALFAVYPFILNGFIHNFRLSVMVVFLCGIISYSILVKFQNEMAKSIKFHFLILTGGLAAFVATLYTFGGIPLLNPALKKLAINNFIWGTAILLFVIGFPLLLPKIKESKNLLLATILSAGLFSLMAFRTEIVLIIMAGTLVAYYSGKLNNKSILIPLLST